MFSIATTTDQESNHFLLPISSSSSSSSTSEETSENGPAPELSSKKRRKPERYQEELLEEMQSILQEMRKRLIQLSATSTKAKVNHALIRDKKRIKMQKRKQKKWNHWLLHGGSCPDLAYYRIHSDLASLLQIPPNTFVRRDDVRTLIASYVRTHRLAKKGIQVELSEELQKVIGPEWTKTIQEGRARFNNFTFEKIAKERNLFGDKAPQPGHEQTREILALLDNESE